MSFRERLYPGLGQEEILSRRCSDARFVYNLGLEQRNLWHKVRTTKITYLTQAMELAEPRKTFTWLEEGFSPPQEPPNRGGTTCKYSSPTKVGEAGHAVRAEAVADTVRICASEATVETLKDTTAEDVDRSDAIDIGCWVVGLCRLQGRTS